MKMAIRGAAASLVMGMVVMVGNAFAEGPAVNKAAALSSEKQKVSYAIGMDVARSFEPIAQDIDLNALQRAIENAFKGGKPLLSDEQTKATDTALRTQLAARSGQPAPGVAPGSQPPQVSKENVGLMLGDRAVGPSLARIQKDIDLPTLLGAVRTVFAKGETVMTQEQAAATLQAFGASKQAAMATENREKGNAFLAHNKTQKGVITTPSGLQYMVLRQGSGERPMPTSKVRVNYEGKLLDGTVFDSSYKNGQPAEFMLNQVVPGWSEGVALMPVGSKYRFWIPSNLGYGAKGTPGGPIGPDATLTFDVELLGILK
ncbi:FKBP-type peptidyl-prolyl cis-trans isomerase [Xanthomonas albilineans]|uniref:Peptidyl-prolyl cis-trans isomerase n=1 Tax=Xanthomonas albilineans (strain GPE PC73 / CFBP 7063) TaxID=380358 RepID=D2UAU9_XANAP|nr:FKBP-type peptidyl-prolyl cis-trans isomerase [Xanthomonas albilineans]QHQ28385.1 putative fkbp-type peptidyl-prolyl cis-trans isomerase protein [Xanthomonas albilineans]CBA16153.1 probable fkbp-type peptidyl-prolyl cis-trans isomerase protein [Xanthomonas albilineans GPE PC73]